MKQKKRRRKMEKFLKMTNAIFKFWFDLERVGNERSNSVEI